MAARRHRDNFAARAIGRWYDEAASARSIVLALVLFVAAWTLFHAITLAPLGLHPDLTELYIWGQHPGAGYYKHPPLGALICTLWFAVFPAADWSFYLLGMLNSAVGLYFTWAIARRVLTGDKVLLSILFVLLTPFYQFFGLKFNANAILLSTWPLATYCFLRAFETRAFSWSIAAGAAAAAALLGKYYSIYLVGSIVIAALTHPDRARYLASPSPWISSATGLLLLVPHVRWLFANDFRPFAYAYAVHGNVGLGDVLLHTGSYLIGTIGYAALPVAVYVLAVRPDRKTLAKTLWPADPARRMLVVLFAGFILLPPLSAPFLGVELVALWTMSAWFLLPIVLLAPAPARFSRAAAVRFAGGLLAFTVIAVVAVAPVLAALNFRKPESDERGYLRPLAAAVTAAWHERVGRPLMFVAGEATLATGVTFYSADHPLAASDPDFSITPWVKPARLAVEGFAGVCRAEDAGCIGWIAELSAAQSRAVRSQVRIVPRFAGYESAPADFIIIIVPPRAFAQLAGLTLPSIQGPR
ncbi:MAG: glycosyltransferase family 39 protein [Pseudolabrys sp.]